MMLLKQTLSLFVSFFLFLIAVSAQELSIQGIKGLRTSHQINQIYRLTTYNNEGLLLGDTRFDNGDLDGLLVHFDQNGKVLKEIRVGRTNSFERIIDLNEHENGYYLLLNSVSQRGKASLLLYHLDKDLGVTSSEEIVIPEMTTANGMVYNPKSNKLEIVVAITDKKDDMFPRLVSYDLENKTQSYIDLNQKNRQEKLEDFEIYRMTKDKDGKRIAKKMTIEELIDSGHGNLHTKINKECMSIRFADKNYDELLITGLENSSAITDFWVANVVDNKVIWEDRFPTDVGGDEGKFTFKTNDGYIVFGHEYTKNANGTLYSYRIVILDKDGKETDEKKFDKSQKDWFKDVVRLGEQHFLMFGQTQSVTRESSFEKEDKINSSNLWAIMVNDKGEMVTDYVHETETIDEAFVLSRLESGDSLIVYKSDGVFKIAKIVIEIP